MLKKAGDKPIVVERPRVEGKPLPKGSEVSETTKTEVVPPTTTKPTSEQQHDAGVNANEAKHDAAKTVAQKGFTAGDTRSVQGNTVFAARLGSASGQNGDAFKATAAFIGETIAAARRDPVQLAAVATGDAKAANNYRPDLLQKPVERVWKQLHSDAVMARIAQDPFLKALHTQVECNVKHAKLEFDITTKDYSHDYVLKGPYAFEPTLAALDSAQQLFKALDAKPATAASSKVAIRETPGEIQAEIAKLEEAHNAFMKGVIANPLATYKDWQARLKTEGPQAKFPEFKELVRYLELFVKKEGVSAAADQSPALAMLRKTALDDLQALQKEGFPYRKTIDTVEKTLGFLDVYERGKPDSTASPDLYHSHRYQYYSAFLKAETPDHVMFPTFYSLGATDLLKTRGVPIGFVGVPPEVTWVDGFSQSPLEFWYHDVNHTRRMWQFFGEHAAEVGLTPMQLAEKSDALVKDVLIPLIKINKTDSEDVKNEKRMMKLILFEILHEDALPADLDVIKKSLLRAPNTITPFEKLVPTASGNEGKVEYVMEPGATTLAYVYRKIAGNFYDMAGMRMDAICGALCRNQEFVAHAAKLLAGKLGVDVPAALIDSYSRDDTGMPDDFRRQLELQLLEDPTRMAPLSTAQAEAAQGQAGQRGADP